MRPKLFLLLAIAASYLVSLISNRFNAYYLDILLGIGINIILAVSLNLINGYTGQFSLGHAGFMAVGAYVAASLTMFAGPPLLPILGGADRVAGASVFFFFGFGFSGGRPPGWG